ncbi:STIP1 y and U box-containing protein 1 [Entomophthora muscae]|uniref:STIP1 y and U box-containing protein 1 n=1 Tax=Entomophthora muscae TaxID=34485 RepID=A0ACC2RH47_9FUNG|nr:STIP1 y and U box-containing protein 1 [Entomophthora muscae]
MHRPASKRKNLEEAVKVFDEIVYRTKSKVAMPLFSRATCYIQLKKYNEAVADCKLLLELPDESIEEGLVPGCTTLHSGVYSRLNNAYKNINMLEEAAAALKSRSLIEDKVKKEKSKETDSVPTKAPDVDKKVEVLKAKANKLFGEKKI